MTAPASRDFSRAGLDKVGDYIKNEIASGKIPGAIVLIQQHGTPVYFEKFGVRDVATKLAMTADTIFRLYSMSKPITSVAAMMLVDDGKLRLDDPVSKYIPAFADIEVGVEKPDENGKTVLEARAAHAPDHDRGFAAPYLRPDLWLLRRQRGAQTLCAGRPVQQRYEQRRIRGADREVAAGGAAGNALGLRSFDRRARPRHRSGIGEIAVSVREGTAARSARDERYRLLRCRRGEAAS